MEKQRILILDKEQINRKLQRMAYQIWEHNSNTSAVTLIGIQGSGVVMAQSLAKRLREISPLQVSVISLRINKRQPLSEAIIMDENLGGRSVVLVDDVANSGKTLLYALRPVLDYEPEKILIAVLVDRKHKSFPISPDIVGQAISTTLQERIEVENSGDEITAAYLD